MKKRYFLVLILILLLFCLNTCFAQDNDTSLDNNLITNDNVKITTYDLVKYYQNDSQFEFNVKENNLPSKDCTVNLMLEVKITLELQTAMEMENLIFI